MSLPIYDIRLNRNNPPWKASPILLCDSGTIDAEENALSWVSYALAASDCALSLERDVLVRDWMTKNPYAVRPESDPVAAISLLKAGGFRHLPVVNTDGELVGIVARTDLEMFLQKAGSPGVLKRSHRVEQVMQRNVVSVAPDCPLEEAAALMVRHKIGSLPVVEEGRLVGIITETDIFSRLAAILGGGGDTLRLTVQVADVPGQLAELAGRIAAVRGNITSIVAYQADQPGRMNFTLRVEGISQETLLQAVSEQEGLQVLHAWKGNRQAASG